jgi:hypothetical protein
MFLSPVFSKKMARTVAMVTAVLFVFAAIASWQVLILPPSTRVATQKELDAFYTGFGGYLDETLGQVVVKFFEMLTCYLTTNCLHSRISN